MSVQSVSRGQTSQFSIAISCGTAPCPSAHSFRISGTCCKFHPALIPSRWRRSMITSRWAEFVSGLRSIMVDDLSALKDDMTAFIEGHGMRRFQGYVSDEVQSVLWDGGENTEAWKDFVELAKASNAPFLTTNDMVLDRNDVDYLITKLERANFTSDEDVEEARW